MAHDLFGRHLSRSGGEGEFIVRDRRVSLVQNPAQLSGLGKAQADVGDGEVQRFRGTVHADAVLRLKGSRYHLPTATQGGGAEGAESELASIASMYVDKESLYIVVFSYVVSPKII